MKARWCCSPARQASGNRGSRPRFWSAIAAEPHTRLRYFCSPQHTDSALHPIIGQMERAAGLAYDDKPQAKLDKLDAVLAQTSTSPEDAALFAEMLSLANDGRYPALELSPEQRRQRTLEALSTQLAALARQQPVLMIFEDAHWVDPTSLEVLGRTVDRIKTLPALLIVTFRPEFNAPWVGQSHVTSLTLNRLGEREAAGIIAGLIGNKESAGGCDGGDRRAHRRHSAVRGGDDEGGAGGGERGRGPAHGCGGSVFGPGGPGKLARLADGAARPARPRQGGGADRLGDRPGVLACAAGVGGAQAEAELASALDRLVQAGLLFRQGVPPQASYLFKHALVQDAAYGTLLREPRRALHARIAETLESQFAETAESQPEILAHHFTEAGLTEAAIEWWGTAGQRSLARSALLEGARAAQTGA